MSHSAIEWLVAWLPLNKDVHQVFLGSCKETMKVKSCVLNLSILLCV
jgi:hypothetical protein